MSQVKPMCLIETMHGKVCMHSDMSFRRRGKKVFTQKICYPSDKMPTMNQQVVQTKFKAVSAATTAALQDADKRAAYEKTWNKNKYYTLRDYIFHEEWANYQE